MDRRLFLKSATGALVSPIVAKTLPLGGLQGINRLWLPGLAGAGTYLSQAEALAESRNSIPQPRLLFVLLRGACDTDSLLYQYGNAFYYKSRPAIAIGREGVDQALKLDQTWAIHPAASPLIKYIDAGQMAFVPFCGTNNTSRSHFLAQKILEQAAGPEYQNHLSNGLLDRLHKQLRQSGRQGQATCLSKENPEICQGNTDIPVLSTDQKTNTKPGQQQTSNANDVLSNLYSGSDRFERYQEYLDAQSEASSKIASESPMSRSTSKGNLRNQKTAVLAQFKSMASLLARPEGYGLGFLEINGWDTHANQGNETGAVATKLETLCEGLDVFAKSMASAWPNTIVVVGTEFGRTFRENGSRGTDHGNASTWMVLSGQQMPSPILGQQLQISESSLHQNRDLPVLNEYRQLLKNILLHRFGMDAQAVNQLLYL